MNVFMHSAEIEKYHYPPQSPFKTERAGMTRQLLQRLGMLKGENIREIPPVPATDAELLLFHSRAYIDALKRVSAGTFTPEDLFLGLGTEDCPVFPGLYPYATLACGGTLTAARLILEGTADMAFNPSGGYHHAYEEKAGGFCYVNDVVLACKVLARAGKRVFCLDLDAHHGNGTQHAFYGTSQVFTVSLHESGETLFPWGGFENETGEGEGKGYNVNLPLPAGTDDDLYAHAFKEIVPPLLQAYAPDVVVLELGMDILSVDPLTHLNMTNNILDDVLPLVLQSKKPLLVVGGGGYHPEATARAWALAWSILCGKAQEEDRYMGMGGVFLGSSEWDAGLRDMHAYTRGEEKETISAKIAGSVNTIKQMVFPYHMH